ncbi:hypothetical protein CAL26_23650 [Bordetella genomosp. 9]|uniref:Lipoprotein n=1 Tax=Bordetella genomosp. 9 TaxID=1416803 RepID=A0A261R756_9BORD|nr:hypothetical protein CAL26_23650 [Bordetella genomosp. 9]
MLSINGARAVSIVAALALSGCAVTQPPRSEPQTLEPEVVVKTRIIDRSCTWFKPVYLLPTDVLGDPTAKTIVGNNEAGVQHCGWKPPSR